MSRTEERDREKRAMLAGYYALPGAVNPYKALETANAWTEGRRRREEQEKKESEKGSDPPTAADY